MTPYEQAKFERMAELKKKMVDLKIPIISQELAKSYSATSKRSSKKVILSFAILYANLLRDTRK
jgi:hypothetical protein